MPTGHAAAKLHLGSFQDWLRRATHATHHIRELVAPLAGGTTVTYDWTVQPRRPSMCPAIGREELNRETRVT